MSAKRKELENDQLDPNPRGTMSTTLANGRYNKLPAAVG
jgi:hypothetical protein